ncbi:MAG: DUF3052 domain-containing protein [Longimicrobiales bacterium]
MSAGYSGTPLVQKLGIRSGMRISVIDSPIDYGRLVADLPPDIAILERPRAALDFVHLFVGERRVLQRRLPSLRQKLVPDGMIWVSWPKKSARVPTDITEDVVREVALPLGLVDVKVCAVDDVWSGLKLVIRRTERASAPPGARDRH